MIHKHRGISFREKRRAISATMLYRNRHRARNRYMIQILDPHFGTCYMFPGSPLSATDKFVRLKFRSVRRKRAFTGWDPDKGRFACRGYRFRRPGFYRRTFMPFPMRSI